MTTTLTEPIIGTSVDDFILGVGQRAIVAPDGKFIATDLEGRTIRAVGSLCKSTIAIVLGNVYPSVLSFRDLAARVDGVLKDGFADFGGLLPKITSRFCWDHCMGTMEYFIQRTESGVRLNKDGLGVAYPAAELAQKLISDIRIDLARYELHMIKNLFVALAHNVFSGSGERYSLQDLKESVFGPSYLEREGKQVRHEVRRLVRLGLFSEEVLEGSTVKCYSVIDQGRIAWTNLLKDFLQPVGKIVSKYEKTKDVCHSYSDPIDLGYGSFNPPLGGRLVAALASVQNCAAAVALGSSKDYGTFPDLGEKVLVVAEGVPCHIDYLRRFGREIKEMGRIAFFDHVKGDGFFDVTAGGIRIRNEYRKLICPAASSALQVLEETGLGHYQHAISFPVLVAVANAIISKGKDNLGLDVDLSRGDLAVEINNVIWNLGKLGFVDYDTIKRTLLNVEDATPTDVGRQKWGRFIGDLVVPLYNLAAAHEKGYSLKDMAAYIESGQPVEKIIYIDTETMDMRLVDMLRQPINRGIYRFDFRIAANPGDGHDLRLFCFDEYALPEDIIVGRKPAVVFVPHFEAANDFLGGRKTRLAFNMKGYTISSYRTSFMHDFLDALSGILFKSRSDAGRAYGFPEVTW